jgi:hypothetical protein
MRQSRNLQSTTTMVEELSTVRHCAEEPILTVALMVGLEGRGRGRGGVVGVIGDLSLGVLGLRRMMELSARPPLY